MHAPCKCKMRLKCTATERVVLDACEMHSVHLLLLTWKMRIECVRRLYKCFRMLVKCAKSTQRELHRSAGNARVCGENGFAKSPPISSQNPLIPNRQNNGRLNILVSGTELICHDASAHLPTQYSRVLTITAKSCSIAGRPHLRVGAYTRVLRATRWRQAAVRGADRQGKALGHPRKCGPSSMVIGRR